MPNYISLMLIGLSSSLIILVLFLLSNNNKRSFSLTFGQLKKNLMLFARLSLILEIDLFYLSILGIRIINLNLTYICGIISPLVLKFENKGIKIAGVILIIISALIWFFIGFLAYWLHLAMFLKKGG